MTIIASKIRGYVAGDDLTIRRTVTDVPVLDVMEYAWLTFKSSKTEVDPGDLQIFVDTNSQAEGYISDTGVDGTGAVEFNITAVQTLALGYDVTYHYDIQVKLESGKIDTVEIGTLRLRQGYTDATS